MMTGVISSSEGRAVGSGGVERLFQNAKQKLWHWEAILST